MKHNVKNNDKVVRIIFLLSILLSFSGFLLVGHYENLHREDSFKSKSMVFEQVFNEQIRSSFNTLFSLQAFYRNSEKVTEKEFSDFARQMLTTNPYISALEWIPKVSSADKASYESSMKTAGYRNFRFFERNEKGEIVNSPEKPFYYPVYYVEPHFRNKAAHGFDLSSRQDRMSAMSYALSTQNLACTEPLQLIQDEKEGAGVLIFLPVDTNDLVLAVLKVDDIFNSIGSQLDVKNIDFFLRDITSAERKLIGEAREDAKAFYNFNVKVGGREWLMTSYIGENYPATQFRWVALIVMLSFSSLIFIYLKRQIQFSSSITELSHAANQLAEGKLKQSIPQTSNSELNALAHAFNDMSLLLDSQREAMDQHTLVSITDIDGRIIYANEMFCKTSGYSLDELMYNNHRIVNSGFHSKDFFAEMWSTIRSGDVWKGMIKNKKKDGTFYWVDATILGYKNSKDEITQFVAIRTDVTAKVENEKKLRSAKEQAEESKSEAEHANSLKSMFLANMSHEIRTPMNAILGFSELLRKNAQTSKEQGYIDNILNSSKTLLRLIDDILNLSKVESGKLTLEAEPVSLTSIVKHVDSLYRPKTEAKGVNLETAIGPLVPPYLMFDEVRILQILINLTGNAVKFTEKGTVSLFVKILKQDTQTADVQFEIIDTGIGIPEDQCDNIFESFTQADGQSLKQYGGTGLGLTISKNLIELMGGTIEVKSKKGQGTHFSVVFSDVKKALRKEEEQISETYDFKKGLILVADDVSTNLEVLEEMLADFNLKTVTAANGGDAVNLAGKCRPDLIFMDLRMPLIDGVEACRQIKNIKKISKIPIIACSANLELYDTTDFDGCIQKPVLQKELAAILNKFLKNNQSEKNSLNFEDDALRLKFFNTFEKKIHACRHLMTVNDILQLSSEIAEFSDKHEFRILAAWAEKLRSAILSAEVKQAERIIDELLTSAGKVAK